MWKNLGAIALFELTLFLVFLTSFRIATDEPAHCTFVNFTEPQTLDPAKMTGQPEGRIAQGIFEGLTVYHPKTLEPLPGMAESWDISPDGRTYTFHIRKDAWWVQREEKVARVTAHDFVYSWRRLMAPETASQYDFLLYYIEGVLEYKEREKLRYKAFLDEWQGKDSSIQTIGDIKRLRPKVYKDYFAQRAADFAKSVGIKAKDDHTLVLQFKAATPYFTDLTCFYALSPVYKDCVEDKPRQWTRPENIVTNGPFYLESWRFNDKIRMTRNRHYWDVKNVGMKTIDALAIEDLTTALNVYLKGGADWIPQVPLPLVPKLEKRDDYHRAPMLSVYYYLVNTTKPPFDGPNGKKIRQALSLALDRQSLIDNVIKQGQTPAYSYVPPGIPNYEGPKGLVEPTREASIARARKLLAEAGYPGGKGLPKINLLYNTSEQHKLIAVAIQNYWKESLGVDIELVNQEWGVYLDSRRQKAFNLARAGWIGDYTDPNTFLDLMVTDGPQNNTGWSLPLYDRLIKHAEDIAGVLADDERRAAFLKDVPQLEPAVAAFLAEEDPKERFNKAVKIRLQVLFRADEIIADELPILPIYFYTSNEMWTDDMDGLYANLRDTHMPKFWRWKAGSPRAKGGKQ